MADLKLSFQARFGRWKPYLIVGSVLLIAGSYLLSTIHYDTNFALVSLYMFLLGAGVGMTMQNLVLIVQNTSKPTEIGVASSGVTFFRSLGGTIGVSVMGAALATKSTALMADAKEDIAAALMSRGAMGAGVGKLVKMDRTSDIKKEVEDVLPPGTSGIIALFDITWKPKVDEALKNASKIDEEEVSPESAAKLKEEAAKA